MTPRFSNACLSLCAALVLLSFASLSPTHAAGTAFPVPVPSPLHLRGILLTPGGTPAADATIVYYLIDMKAHAVSSEQTLQPTAAGTFDILWTRDPKAYLFPVIYVTAPEGVAVVRLDVKEMKVTLEPATSVRVHLLDNTGQPLAHVRVCPQSLSDRDDVFGGWDAAITDRLSAVTDETGTATLSGLPQGRSLVLDVDDPRYVPPAWDQNIRLAKTSVTPDATVRVFRGGSISGTVVYGPTRQPAPNISVSATPVSEGPEGQYALTDAEGNYRMPTLPFGTYNVSVTGNLVRIGSRGVAAHDWTAPQQSAAVTAGSTTSGVNFTLMHGGVLTGTVTETKTGKPLPQVGVFVLGPAGEQNVRTGDDGRYTIHLPPGSQRVILEADPGMTPDQQQFVDLADGETKMVNFRSTAPIHPVVVQGIVVGPDGKPVAGARVTAASQGQQEQDTKQVTDAQGRFVFAAPGIMPDMRLYATAGALATPAGTLAAEGKPVTLRLASSAKLVVQGRVMDPVGKALAGASVTLFRQNSSGAGGTGIGTTTTNSAGKYMFTPAVPDATYSTMAQAKGFAYQFSKEVKGIAGRPLNFGVLTLPRTDSFVGGTVVDINGKPIAGADVSSMGASDIHTITDARGRFHLGGATRGKVILEVRAAGGRFASIEVPSGRDDDTITAASEDEEEAESKRLVALRDADPTNHGDGASASVLLRLACDRARQSNKKVLLVFHASWCGPCFLLHRFLNDPLVKPVLDAHFITQDIDIWEKGADKKWENPGGDILYSRYGSVRRPGHYQGVPYFAVLDAAGRNLGDARLHGDNIGFPSDAAGTEFFLKTLKAASPTLTAAELATLKAGLARDAKI